MPTAPLGTRPRLPAHDAGRRAEPVRGTRWTGRLALVLALALAALGASAPASAGARRREAPRAASPGPYPVGTPDPSEPSALAPPGPGALPGYRLAYVTDFSGASIPPGWDVFTGIPGGDPGGHFGVSHTRVTAGVLELLTYRNPAYHDRWVTGGICQCGRARVYGAYFVRSRQSGPGPNEVQLLWPLTNRWPPEIDFNETGGSATSTTTSVHFGAHNTVLRSGVRVDMTAWHTWGVVWTPSEILFVVDGRVFGRVSDPAAIPRVRMTLDFEQRAMCSLHRQCPTAPEQMEVDWVAEYVPGP